MIQIHIDIRFTEPQKRILRIAATAAIAIAVLGVGVVLAAPQPFNPNEVLTSSKMNANFTDLQNQISALQAGTVPTMQPFTVAGTYPYKLPTNPKPLYLVIEMVGPGGGGAGNGMAQTNGSNGTAPTTFADLNAGPGGGANANTAGAGGTSSCGSVATCVALTGNDGGGYIFNLQYTAGGAGGASPLFGGGVSTLGGGVAGRNGAAPGAGGSGGGSGSTATGVGEGGGSGGAIRAVITNPASSYSVVVGGGGSGGGAGSGLGGGAGHDGAVIIWEYYR